MSLSLAIRQVSFVIDLTKTLNKGCLKVIDGKTIEDKVEDIKTMTIPIKVFMTSDRILHKKNTV